MKIAGTLIRLLSVYVTVSFSLAAAAEPTEISIGVSDDLAVDIVQAMEKNPDVCKQDDFFSSDWLRTTYEFIVVCRAIRIGGIDATYTFQNFPNSSRAIAEMEKGTFMIMADLPWKTYIQDKNLYQSNAVLGVGDFVKGLYTRPDHAALLNVKTLKELRSYKVVTNKVWFYDWQALERMKVEKVSVPKYIQMAKMVESGRADYFIGEFPGADDLSQYVEGVRFVPVPGLKIALLGSRHVAVSKMFPHSKQVFDAVQIGLKNLTERGLIKQGYRTVGFYNPRVKDWKILCCE